MTGCSPCMKATRELVVPRSMPTMRSVVILQFSNRVIVVNLKPLVFASTLAREQFVITRLHNYSIFQRFIYISNQIPQVRSPIQQVHHFVSDVAPILFSSIVGKAVPIVPICLQFLGQRLVLLLQLQLLFAYFLNQGRIVFAELFLHAKL